MEHRTVHASTDTAPVTGTYELLNPGGVDCTQVRVPVFQGTAFPPAPLGWLWRLAGTRLPAD
jgi:hypothetical protein